MAGQIIYIGNLKIKKL